MKTNTKSFLMFAVVASLLSAVSAQAQEAATPSSTNSGTIGARIPVQSPEVHHVAIGIEPHWLLIGGFGMQADVRLSRRTALAIGGLYVPPRENFNNSDSSSTSYDPHYKYSIYEAYLGPSFMLTGDYDRNGLYVMPAVGYAGSSISEYGSSKLSAAIESPEARLTVGYQFVVSAFRFTTGAGMRFLNSSDVVVKDSSGNEVLTEKSDSFGGLALDMRASYLF
jgi:hypothetical protein